MIQTKYTKNLATAGKSNFNKKQKFHFLFYNTFSVSLTTCLLVDVYYFQIKYGWGSFLILSGDLVDFHLGFGQKNIFYYEAVLCLNALIEYTTLGRYSSIIICTHATFKKCG